MKKEQFSSDWIDRFRDNDLNDVEKLLFLEHLKHNSELRREFELDQQFDNLMGDADTLEFLEILKSLPHREKMIKRRIRRLVAAAAIVGILMFGMAYLLIHRMIKVDMTATTLTKKALYDSNLNIEPAGAIPRAPAPKPELIREKPGYHIGKQNESDLYQPLQEYEWLVGAEYREGVLELAFPSPDTTIFLDGAIRFRWHITSGEDDHVTVIIVNNKGKVVRETKIDRDEQGVSVQAGTLGPGLFYWKLIFADNIAGMGKVTIVLPFIK